jgi:leucyl aminopeptidase
MTQIATPSPQLEPKISLEKLNPGIHQKTGLVIFVYQGPLAFDADLLAVLGNEQVLSLATFAKRRNFTGQAREILYVPLHDTHLTLLVGLGPKQKANPDSIRQASAIAVRFLRKMHVSDFCLVWPRERPQKTTESALVTAATDGILHGAYEFDRYQTTPKHPRIPVEVTLMVRSRSSKLDEALQTELSIARQVNYARDLQNENSDIVNPQSFSQLAQEIAHEHGMSFKVITGADVKKQGLNLLHAVGRASAWPPALICVEYQGNKRSKKKLALVGKGVTFDTGGINLKTSSAGALPHMHMDMSGAATVLAVLIAISQLKLKANIIAIMPLAENAIGAESTKPGAIVRAYDGTTVEIANTDAEGRLILADAIAYVAKNYTPDAIIDIATLTSAVIFTFGDQFAGLVTNSNQLAKSLQDAATKTSEPIWRLPLTDGYRAAVRGKKSDLVNSILTRPERADAIQAAAFLEHFTQSIPYAHIDMSGVANRKRTTQASAAGGAGFGVRLLVEFLRHYS